MSTIVPIVESTIYICTATRWTEHPWRKGWSNPTSRLPLPHDSSSDTAKTVLLLAWVNCDGSVLETDYLSGPPELFKLAHDAVEKWKYHPSVNNGTPMEVRTTVTVVFGPSE